MRVCLSCTTIYADAPTCPHCGSEKGDDMAKISQAGGPTHGPAAPVEPAVEPPVEPAVGPVAEETDQAVELEPEPELLAEVVPSGNTGEVIDWTEADPSPPARILAALDAERARPTTRVTLLGELERRLAQF